MVATSCDNQRRSAVAPAPVVQSSFVTDRLSMQLTVLKTIFPHRGLVTTENGGNKSSSITSRCERFA